MSLFHSLGEPSQFLLNRYLDFYPILFSKSRLASGSQAASFQATRTNVRKYKNLGIIVNETST